MQLPDAVLSAEADMSFRIFISITMAFIYSLINEIY